MRYTYSRLIVSFAFLLLQPVTLEHCAVRRLTSASPNLIERLNAPASQRTNDRVIYTLRYQNRDEDINLTDIRDQWSIPVSHNIRVSGGPEKEKTRDQGEGYNKVDRKGLVL